MADCRLRVQYSATKVHIVAGGSEGDVRVIRDGALWGLTPVSQTKLYTVINDPDGPGKHTLELEFQPGQELYAFTFG